MGDNAFTEQLGALRASGGCTEERSRPSCPVGALSPIAGCPSGGGTERALKGLCGGRLTFLWGVSAMGKWPVHRLNPNYTD
eukprot:8616922-Alexandrium_andersonii.AAC.1